MIGTDGEIMRFTGLTGGGFGLEGGKKGRDFLLAPPGVLGWPGLKRLIRVGCYSRRRRPRRCPATPPTAAKSAPGWP